MLLCGGSDASNYWLRLRSELSDKRIATNPLILEMPWLTGHSPEYVRLIPNEKDSLPQITDKMKKTKERNRSTLWHMLLGPCLTKPEPYPTSVAMLSKSIHETFRRSPFLK
jgi:hypothetical protein